MNQASESLNSFAESLSVEVVGFPNQLFLRILPGEFARESLRELARGRPCRSSVPDSLGEIGLDAELWALGGEPFEFKCCAEPLRGI